MLSVYAPDGSLLDQPVDGEKPAGTFEVVLDAASVPEGVSSYVLTAGEFIATRSMERRHGTADCDDPTTGLRV